MDLHDSRNIRRVLHIMSAEWGQPVWKVKHIIQQAIDQRWEKAMLDPEEKALLDKYFPDGKPTPEQYVLWLGHAHEKGEDMPYLLEDLR